MSSELRSEHGGLFGNWPVTHPSQPLTDCAAAIEGKFDIVIANILAAPLIELAASIANRVKTGGMLALSGILLQQIESVLGAYDAWIDFEKPVCREQDGQTWARLTGVRGKG